MSNMTSIQVGTFTDPGHVRGHNEDFIRYWEPKTTDEEELHGWLYIVADGVGGAEAGEVASEYATDRARYHFVTTSENPNWGERLVNAMYGANTDLRQLVADLESNRRMATTMVALLIHDQKASIGNVGDSRGYHWRNGILRQVTKDQSLVAKLLEEGAITEVEAANHPRKNVILYSIGSEKNPKIDLFEIDLYQGDIFLLCSDGLTRHVDDHEIERVLGQLDPPEAAQALGELANQRGGEDNITVCVVRYGEAKRYVRPPVTAVATPETPPFVASTPPPPVDTLNHSALWAYTIFLSLLMTSLIFLLHLYLRV